MKSSRRDFIHQLSFAFGSVLFLPACSGYDSHWRFFTEKEAKTVLAFAEQIIPADKDPGASDANVINFIDKQLLGPYLRFQNDYRAGIPAIEKAAQQLHQKNFYDLAWKTQTQFMEQMEKGELPKEAWKDVNQRTFFNLLLEHSMQGFYGSPRHGGNKDYASFKMMKIDYPHVIGQNRYDEKRRTKKTHVQ